ncbi:MAG: DUF1580 domain-containing protein, partial [Pirellula sp.]
LKYFNDAPVAAAGGGDFEKTMIIRKPASAAPAPAPAPAAMAAAPTAAAPAPAANVQTNPKPIPAPTMAPASPAPAASAHDPNGPARDSAIQVLSGAAAGRTLDLTKNLTTIGKPGVQVAVITRRPTGFFITHVEGTSFPTINGVPKKFSTVYRHCTKGLKGIVLESQLNGGQIYTSAEAIQRFMQAVDEEWQRRVNPKKPSKSASDTPTSEGEPMNATQSPVPMIEPEHFSTPTMIRTKREEAQFRKRQEDAQRRIEAIFRKKPKKRVEP